MTNKEEMNRIPHRAAWWALLIFVALVLPLPGGESSERLSTMRDQFEELKADALSEREKLDTRYLEELAKLEEKAQGEGKLQLVLAIRAEKKGFRSRKPAAANLSPHAELARLQEIYDEQRVQAKEVMKRKLSSLLSGYKAQLEELQTKLTKEGKIDEAVVVQAEIERVAAAWPADGGTRPGGVSGRYVRVELPRGPTTLQIAELEVFDIRDNNVARGGEASQSGKVHSLGAARHAIDGNTDGEVTHKSLALTGGDNLWWEVDLRGERQITQLVFWSRNGLQERMDGMKISVLNLRRETLWEKTITKAPRRKLEIDLAAESPSN